MLKVFDGMRRGSIAASTLALTGCAAGDLTWGDGTDILRTAIYKEVSSDGVHTASILLSNSHFPCALPDTDDPRQRTQHIAELLAAACREDARHVNIRLFRQGGADWTGVYEGRAEAAVTALGPDAPRLADAAYYGVDEAFLVSLGEVDRAYAVSEGELQLEVAEGGEVEITRDGDVLTGTFAFPHGALQGDFRATACEADTSVLDLLEPSPSHVCP